MTSPFEGSKKRACAKPQWNCWGAGFLSGVWVLSGATLIMVAVDELLHQSTLAIVCAVLAVMPGVSLVGDVVAGWWSPEILKPSAPSEAIAVPPNCFRVWHVTTSEESAWSGGIQWKSSAHALFGAGFYTWPDLRDACRYAPKADATLGLVEILIPQALWDEACVVMIPHKITWNYWYTVTVIALMLFHRSSNPPPRRIGHHADIIVAPAQSMPWTCRQWVFRPTPTVQTALAHAVITYHPIFWTN